MHEYTCNLMCLIIVIVIIFINISNNQMTCYNAVFYKLWHMVSLDCCLWLTGVFACCDWSSIGVYVYFADLELCGNDCGFVV